MTLPYRAVSLFSNCGAGDLGFRKSGFRFSVMAELCQRRLDVCLLNHPEAVGVVGDLRETWPLVVERYKNIAGDQSPDLLCACPPCQGMSSARPGKGAYNDPEAGSRDSRNLLVTVIASVTSELKPRIIVVENVPAFLTRKVFHPETHKPISAAKLLIEWLKDQYEVFSMTSDLSDFGVPQSRKRAFLTFVRRDLPTLSFLKERRLTPFPSASKKFTKQPKTVADILEKSGLPPLDASSKELASVAGYRGLHTVPAWTEDRYRMVASIPKYTGGSAWENNICPVCGKYISDEEAVVCDACGNLLMRPIVKSADGSYRLVRGFKSSSYRRMKANSPASTITTASGHIGSDITIHPWQNRVLSPLECAIIQTFPRNFKWGDTLKKYGITSIREMIGEAVPPLFTEKHGKTLCSLLSGDANIRAMPEDDSRVKKAMDLLSD